MAHYRPPSYSDFVRDVAANHNVGDGEPPAGLEHAKSFEQHAVLVRGEIDHAIGNDDIHGIIRQRNVLDLAAKEFHVLDAGLALVLLRQRQHFVCHVQAIGLSRGADASG